MALGTKKIDAWGRVFLLLMIVAIEPFSVLAQVVIEEELELTSDSSQIMSVQYEQNIQQQQQIMNSGTLSIPIKENGVLKMVFENSRRFEEPFDRNSRLHFNTIGADGNSKRVNVHFPEDFFSEPVQGRLTPDCAEPWYLYGKGPFEWLSGSSEDAIDDAWVFSLKCDKSYAKNTGKCRTTNFGGSSDISAWAWTWLGVPALVRSFVRFNGLEFSDNVKPDEARLFLYETGGPWGSSELSGSNEFVLSRVNSGWDENTVTWVNMPGAGSPHISGPPGTDNVELDVMPTVQIWLDNPESNYGFRLSLQNEQHYRIRSFGSSESFAPPQLKVTVSNPDASSDTLEVAFVQEGEVVEIDYESDGEVLFSNTEMEKNINGKSVAGRKLIFSIDGPSCGDVGFSERLEAFAWVEPSPLTLKIPEPKEAWPTIPDPGGAPTNFEFSAVENMKEDIEVLLYDKGDPVSDHQVQIVAKWISRSGGHYHDGSKNDEPILKNMGSLLNTSTGDSLRGRLTTATDADGKINLRYWTPEFGGEVVLEAQATLNGKQLTARDTLEVKVPDLVRLPDGMNYAKVGGTNNHYGPRLDSDYPDSRTPDNNHFGTQAFVDSLISLANDWQRFVLEDSTQDNRQTPLNINDMSLSNGGLFDVSGRWRPSHNYHRVGRDVDIRTTRDFPMNPSVRNGILLKRVVIAGEEQYINEDFEDLWTNKGADPTPAVHGDFKKGTEHYHIYFYR